MKGALWFMLGSIFVCLVVAYAAYSLGMTVALLHFLDHPGGLFAVITGGATLAGVWLTLKSVQEFRLTITTFSDLIDRVCDLIDSTVNSKNGKDFVRFLAYTPLPGSLALSDNEWHRIRNRLEQYQDRIKIACLTRNDLEKMHSLYLGRQTDQGTIGPEKIRKINERVEQLIDDFSNPSQVVRRPKERFPRYYLFASKRRAIIAIPIFLPLTDDELKQEEINKLPPVHMFGFETADSEIVKYVHTIFEIYHP